MRIFVSLLALAAISCSPGGESAEEKRPNVLLIAVDDLRPELASFGVDYIHSPNIDRLASTGRVFRSHYVQAPTCGASRYTLLTGRYGGASNNAIFERAARLRGGDGAVPPSMPAWFREHGYTTVSVGKVSHHPGGWGGKTGMTRPTWRCPSRGIATCYPPVLGSTRGGGCMDWPTARFAGCWRDGRLSVRRRG